MITERNMIFANPQAYRVFPQIGNPYNTGIIDTAIYEGYLQVTDTNGTTKSFTNTSTIDFTGFQGIVDIDQHTNTGSVKLGRWNIGQAEEPEPEPEPSDSWKIQLVTDPRFDIIPAEGITVTDTDNYYIYMVATNEAQGKTINIPAKYCRADVLYNSWVTINGNTTTTHEGTEVTAVSFTAEPNTEQKSRVAQHIISLDLNAEEAHEIFGDPNIMGFRGSYNLFFRQEAAPWISPYTPMWSAEFPYILAGVAAKQINNGIEVYSTGPDTNSDTATFFNYGETIKEGETYRAATIQVTGMKEGYTIVGVRGWESVTITQDGEYTLPAYTWTNEQGLPEGSDIYNDYKPALKFAVGTESNVVWDEPITIVITAVETMEQSVQKAMVLWYDLAKQGATNESMAADPRLIDLSGNGHHATCYNFAWTEQSGISSVNYPYALVSDAVDDYVQVTGLPILTKERGWTVIGKEKTITLVSGRFNIFAKKTDMYYDDEFAIFYHNNEKQSIYNYGSDSFFNWVNNDIVVATSDSVPKGESDTYTEKMELLGNATKGGHLSAALYSFLLFNRVLTSNEIEWVKTNLITE